MLLKQLKCILKRQKLPLFIRLWVGPPTLRLRVGGQMPISPLSLDPPLRENVYISAGQRERERMSHLAVTDLLWISDRLRPRFLAIIFSEMAESESNFRTVYFSSGANFCPYSLLTKKIQTYGTCH